MAHPSSARPSSARPSSARPSSSSFLALAAAAAAAAAAGAAAAAPAPCASDLDCALNGACSESTGLCACDVGWRGADCSMLDLLPTPQASGLHVENVSSWGGSVLPFPDAASGETVMFASVFVNCGLTSWTRNSYIARTVSAGGVDAPFAVAGTAIPPWSHNVVALNATGFGLGDGSDEAYLIFHIGDGTASNSSLQACSPGGSDSGSNGGGDGGGATGASYTFSAGFLPAGGDVFVGAPGNFSTAVAAETWCTANATCKAFTYMGPPDSIPATASVFFKGASGPVSESASWSSYARDLPPGPAASANGTSQCGLLWFPCEPPPTCDDLPVIDGYVCESYACGGDDAPWPPPQAAGAGLRDDVDCGPRLKDINLTSCVGPAECAAEAAGACEATPGCLTFAISSFLDSYRWAMLFSAGREGLRPNAQWNAYVRSNSSVRSPAPQRQRAQQTQQHRRQLLESQALAQVQAQARARARARSARALQAQPGNGDGSTFPVSYSTSLLGPWTTVYANTTTATNGNNPAPFLARNGSVYVVFNDGGMSMFRSDAGFRGPYNLITRNTCGGGEDPVIWLGTRGWHCLYRK